MDTFIKELKLEEIPDGPWKQVAEQIGVENLYTVLRIVGGRDHLHSKGGDPDPARPEPAHPGRVQRVQLFGAGKEVQCDGPDRPRNLRSRVSRGTDQSL